MGTHSTVKFYNRGRHNILSVYNQFDGYITGEGAELVKFLTSEEWKGNGFDDTALLYVCFKKQSKPYHTYATTEYDLQEYNYKIYDTDEGIRISILEERWLEDTNEHAFVETLRYGTIDDLREYVEEENIKEQAIMNSRTGE